MAEGRGLDPQCLRIQSASNGCRPPGRSTFLLADGGRTRSPCLAAPSVFKTAPATRPVHHPYLIIAAKLVRVAGFDPATSRFQAEGSTRLSYTLLNWRRHGRRRPAILLHRGSDLDAERTLPPIQAGSQYLALCGRMRHHEPK